MCNSFRSIRLFPACSDRRPSRPTLRWPVGRRSAFRRTRPTSPQQGVRASCGGASAWELDDPELPLRRSTELQEASPGALPGSSGVAVVLGHSDSGTAGAVASAPRRGARGEAAALHEDGSLTGQSDQEDGASR